MQTFEDFWEKRSQEKEDSEVGILDLVATWNQALEAAASVLVDEESRSKILALKAKGPWWAQEK